MEANMHETTPTYTNIDQLIHPCTLSYWSMLATDLHYTLYNGGQVSDVGGVSSRMYSPLNNIKWCPHLCQTKENLTKLRFMPNKMFGRGDFNESYYEHGCSIIPEKDVIDTDIRGTGRAASLKRWWFDLILLSYADKRARIYYNSSYAIKMERMRHFRLHRNCIHPLSKFRSYWDLIILLVMVVECVLTNHATCVITGQYSWFFYAFGVLLEFILIFDIYMNTRCGYINHDTRNIVFDANKSLIRYCSTKLFFHAASAIPILTIMFFRYGMDISYGAYKANTFVCTLNFINIIKLFRLYEVSSYLTRERKSYRVTRIWRFLRLWLLAGMSALQFICSYSAVTMLHIIDTETINNNNYNHILIHAVFLNYPNSLIFTHTFYNVLTVLLHFNYGFNSDMNYIDKISTIILYCVTSVFHLNCLFELYTCVHCKKFPEDQILFNKFAVINMAKSRQLPDKLAYKLKSYFDFNMTKHIIVEKQSGFYKSLPAIIKTEILTSAYIRKLIRIPYFSNWSMRVIEKLISLLKEEIYLKNDVVAEFGEPGNGLVIIDAGVMAVYSPEHVEKGHLIDGDYFGEISLVTDKERLMTYVVAVTNCKVITLEKSTFRKFMREHSELFFEMKQKIKKKYLTSEASASLQES